MKLRTTALLLTLALSATKPAAAPFPAIKVSEVDDGADPAAFATYLSRHARIPHEELPFSSRLMARVVDADGSPLPFVDYRILSSGAEAASGETRSDGWLFLLSSQTKGGSCRVELSARGSSMVGDAVFDASTPAKFTLVGARALDEPVACDVVFIIDTTISMAGRLPAIKAAIQDATRNLAAQADPRFPLSSRLGLVLFRDDGSGYVTKSLPLTADADAFYSALSNAEARGGGDIPEALGEGLAAAVDGMGWRKGCSRLAFVFTDAPPSRRGGGYAKASLSAAGLGIRIYTVGMDSIPEEGEYALRQIAAFTGGCYLAASGRQPELGGSRGLVFGQLAEIIGRIISGDLSMARGKGVRGSSGDRALALLDSVQARMVAGLVYPESARLRSTGGKVRLRLRIKATGDLAEIKVVGSSGSAILDRAAQELAGSAFPLQNPADEEVELEITVGYRLE